MSKDLSIFCILALLLSFPTVNAVLLTPALPLLTTLFNVSINSIEGTFIWFLAGYCLGQLIYSPLDNRYGRMIALCSGIALQIISSLIALYACYTANFHLLIFSRFCLALGSGVGLMMTFTIVSEYYPKDHVQRIIAYLSPSFAIVPAIGILISGYLTNYYGWSANFYLAVAYGIVMLVLCTRLPISKKQLNRNIFSVKNIIEIYRKELCNTSLIVSGMLMGCCVAFVYIFSTIVPFVTSSYFHFNSVDYGIANSFSALGLLTGAFISAKLSTILSKRRGILFGVTINLIGSLGILLGEYFNIPAFTSFFVPFFLINLGSCFVLSCASAMALDNVTEKSNASAIMSFINVGTTTLIMLVFSYFSLNHYLLSLTFISLSLLMLALTLFEPS